MKDLYSFDKDEANSVNTYDKICQTYEKILKQIGVKYIKGKKIKVIQLNINKWIVNEYLNK